MHTERRGWSRVQIPSHPATNPPLLTRRQPQVNWPLRIATAGKRLNVWAYTVDLWLPKGTTHRSPYLRRLSTGNGGGLFSPSHTSGEANRTLTAANLPLNLVAWGHSGWNVAVKVRLVRQAWLTQLVESQPSKLQAASSSPAPRSKLCKLEDCSNGLWM